MLNSLWKECWCIVVTKNTHKETYMSYFFARLISVQLGNKTFPSRSS